MIFVALWAAVCGIWPFANPDHSMHDAWFPLDLIVHIIGTAYVFSWCINSYRKHKHSEVTIGEVWDAIRKLKL